MKKISEDEILERLRVNDKSALEALYKSHYKRLCSYAYRIIENGDYSRDIVNESFIIIWEKRHAISGSLYGYLFMVVRYLSWNHLRNTGAMAESLDLMYDLENYKHVFETTHDPLEKLIHSELQEKIEQLISQLPDQCKAVFQLSRKEELKNREIAEKLNINIKTVEKHINKALTYLRNELLKI